MDANNDGSETVNKQRVIEEAESLQTFTHEILTEREIPQCVALAINNFDEFKAQPAHIEQWFEQRIIRNPWQSALPGMGVGIRHEGRLIAFRAMFAQPWWLNGTEAVIAFCANTTVDHEYRGKGLATQLIDDSRVFAEITGSTTAGVITQKAYNKLGFSEVGGAGNDFFRCRVSYRGSLVKRFGNTLGTLAGKGLDLSLQYKNRKHHSKAGFYLEEKFHCDEEFDCLWEQAKSGYISCLERSSAYLNWRLFDAPTCQLHLSALYDPAANLKGFAIWHVQQFSDSVSMAVLRDIFYPQTEQDTVKTLLALLFEHWRQQGISWANLEVASPQLSALFKSLGYESLPSRGNRYQIYSNPPLTETVLQNWFRSAIDGDYFDHPL